VTEPCQSCVLAIIAQFGLARSIVRCWLQNVFVPDPEKEGVHVFASTYFS
jgi:hypothetical protein